MKKPAASKSSLGVSTSSLGVSKSSLGGLASSVGVLGSPASAPKTSLSVSPASAKGSATPPAVNKWVMSCATWTVGLQTPPDEKERQRISDAIAQHTTNVGGGCVKSIGAWKVQEGRGRALLRFWKPIAGGLAWYHWKSILTSSLASNRKWNAFFELSSEGIEKRKRTLANPVSVADSELGSAGVQEPVKKKPAMASGVAVSSGGAGAAAVSSLGVAVAAAPQPAVPSSDPSGRYCSTSPSPTGSSTRRPLGRSFGTGFCPAPLRHNEEEVVTLRFKALNCLQDPESPAWAPAQPPNCSGSNGVIQWGYHPDLRMKVAVKVARVDPHVLSPAIMTELEALLLVKNHPNFVQLVDVIALGNPCRLGFVTERIDFNLRVHMEGAFEATMMSPFSASGFILGAKDLVAALNFLACHHIIHTDVKPCNILVHYKKAQEGVERSSLGVRTTEFRLMLCDMGNVICDRPGCRSYQFHVDQVKDGFVAVGSAPYRSPELWCGAAFFHGEIDVWSTGVALAECARGGFLFHEALDPVNMRAKLREVCDTTCDLEYLQALPYGSEVDWERHPPRILNAAALHLLKAAGATFLHAMLLPNPKCRATPGQLWLMALAWEEQEFGRNGAQRKFVDEDVASSPSHEDEDVASSPSHENEVAPEGETGAGEFESAAAPSLGGSAVDEAALAGAALLAAPRAQQSAPVPAAAPVVPPKRPQLKLSHLAAAIHAASASTRLARTIGASSLGVLPIVCSPGKLSTRQFPNGEMQWAGKKGPLVFQEGALGEDVLDWWRGDEVFGNETAMNNFLPPSWDGPPETARRPWWKVEGPHEDPKGGEPVKMQISGRCGPKEDPVREAVNGMSNKSLHGHRRARIWMACFKEKNQRTIEELDRQVAAVFKHCRLSEQDLGQNGTKMKKAKAADYVASHLTTQLSTNATYTEKWHHDGGAACILINVTTHGERVLRLFTGTDAERGADVGIRLSPGNVYMTTACGTGHQVEHAAAESEERLWATPQLGKVGVSFAFRTSQWLSMPYTTDLPRPTKAWRAYEKALIPWMRSCSFVLPTLEELRKKEVQAPAFDLE